MRKVARTGGLDFLIGFKSSNPVLSTVLGEDSELPIMDNATTQHWAQPNAMAGEKKTLHLGNVQSLTRTVAPFWIESPRKLSLIDAPQFSPSVSQPGPGLTLQ